MECWERHDVASHGLMKIDSQHVKEAEERKFDEIVEHLHTGLSA